MKKVFILLCLLSIPLVVMSQEQINLSDLEAKVIEAKNDYVMGNLEKAISNLTYVVQQLEITKSQRPLTQQESAVYMQGLNYLAQSYLASGKDQEAQYYFATLIQFQPVYSLDPVLTSPKIVNYFNNLKKTLIGYLSLSVNPSDAIIYLDDQKAGQGILYMVPLIGGSHKLMIERAGHSTLNKEIIMISGKNTNMGSINLSRNTSVCFITTYPSETEVILDGKTIGFTAKGAPGDLSDYAKTNKLDLNNFSAYFPVPIEDAIEHIIEFKKPCYEKEQIIVKYAEKKDYYYEPVVLKASHAQLQLDSKENAKVYIDGGYSGDLKQKNFQICSGSHKLVVKAPWGNFSVDINLKEGDSKKITVEIKPSLVYLGLISDPIISADTKKHIEELTSHYLSSVKQLNIVNKQKDKIVIKEVEKSSLEIATALYNDYDKTAWDSLKDQLKLLSPATDSHLFFFGYILPEKTAKKVVYFLFSDFTTVPDKFFLDIDNESLWKLSFALLDTALPLYRYLLPLVIVDSLQGGNPVVVEVKDKKITQINPGDLIKSINKTPVNTQKEIAGYLDEKNTGDISLEVYSNKSSSVQTVKLSLSASPYEIAYSNKPMALNKELIYLMKFSDSEDKSEKNTALFNIGLLYFKMLEWNKAYEYLNQLTLSRNTGITSQTIKYRAAQCMIELGYKKDAQKILENLIQDTASTIEDDYGPAVSAAAKSYIELVK